MSERSLNEIEQWLFLNVGPHWRLHSDEELSDMSQEPVELIAIVRSGDGERLRQWRQRKDAQRES